MSPLIKMMLAAIGIMGLFMVNQSADRVTAYINGLPVEGSLRKGAELVPAHAPEPLVALKAAAPATAPAAADGDLEKGFVRDGLGAARPVKAPVAEAEPTVPKPPAVDALVIGRMRLSGVTPEGAFINGAFVAVGQPINMVLWEGADGRTPHIPMLKSTEDSTAVIYVPQSKTTVTLRLPG